MLVPGQVDRWIILADSGQFSLLKLPISIFKQANREMSNNYLENSHKFLVVNMTWFQSSLAKTFKAFLDAEVQAKMAFSSDVYPPELKELVHPSQLERKYGGTAPNLTTFWPPHVPPIEFDPSAISRSARKA